MQDYNFSTGLSGLDDILKGLRTGDNVVWQTDSIEDSLPFVMPFSDYCLFQGIPLIYIRFARHKPLLREDKATAIYRLNPQQGFEDFIFRIHSVIHKHGKGCCYVFDCLSNLSSDWYSDRMLGNFFMLTCPYLAGMDTIAYFTLLRNRHSFHATSPILNVTQLFLDVFRHDEGLYLHPLKVDNRYSPTMNTLHQWQGERFIPVRSSEKISRVLASKPWSRLDSALQTLGYWSMTFAQAEQILNDYEQGLGHESEVTEWRRKLLKMIFSRDQRILELADKYISLKDILFFRRRMIGTGLMGGKSSGFLLARAMLKKNDPEKWNDKLEPHDSFYIGSDVFYTFLVQNGVWWIRQQQRDPDLFLKDLERARTQILGGSFPHYIVKQFVDLLDYFGQWPFIVRSSSLMEDNFGNIFAGKYESVFCSNQGTRGQRLAAFIEAVRQVYASSISEKALVYRKQRGLLDRDEQMALLVQRVSGENHGKYFFPQAAGVGFSFNPYVWDEKVDPESGMLRLVFGLGTRAVNRSDDDYTRVIALNEPSMQPLVSLDGHRHTQQKVDVLDLEQNEFSSVAFQDLARACPDIPLDLFAQKDRELQQRARNMNLSDFFPWVLSFKKLLMQTDFAQDMQDMLNTLEKAYGATVDIEYTVNSFPGYRGMHDYLINLVQCRPLEIKGSKGQERTAREIPEDRIIVKSTGPVIGQSRTDKIDRIIYVCPEKYGYLSQENRHAVARLVGRIAHEPSCRSCFNIMLMGPGRWGTSIASLGVPVSFTEISTVSVLCEIVAMRGDFVPDVSLGTHFFSDLIEFDILYLALYPDRQGNIINRGFLEKSINRLETIFPEEKKWTETVFVIDQDELGPGRTLHLYADVKKQSVLCFSELESGL
ncbi:PEP/pyruvate-binding domain-containing protein [Desulfonatronovibrio hydrogenovorans]|uniref:PEP/pyruvate-binding domain-containing protein n=1 Tax=Desulfonatronovibrio hydrogenovorans TaxID=53245 RepID=UPI000491FF53|nr:PEP/pyruvate-binding domain-containing protein [Desulfonatronovibrio hydrogenovorans]